MSTQVGDTSNFARFYYRSFCDKSVTGYSLALSTDYDADTLAYAIDRDKTTAATTDGKDTDGTSADFIVDLQWARSIDAIFLRSNFKAYDVYHSLNGSAWTKLSQWGYSTNSVENNADAFNALLLAAPISARYIKITCAYTITANQEKKVYELSITKQIAALELSELQDPNQRFARISNSNIKGGSVQLVLFPQSPKFRARVLMKNMGADYADYDALKDRFIIDACLVYLYYTTDKAQLGPEALYLCNDTADKKFPFSTSYLTTAGNDGEIQLEEV